METCNGWAVKLYTYGCGVGVFGTVCDGTVVRQVAFSVRFCLYVSCYFDTSVESIGFCTFA